MVGDQITIGECIAPKSVPQSNVYWRDKDGKTVDGESVVQVEDGKYTTTNTLTIIADKTENDQELAFLYF